ncbi:MAG: flagellar protein FlaG [Chromatiaceae bacterium]|jgi:flagellar protein FlaG
MSEISTIVQTAAKPPESAGRPVVAALPARERQDSAEPGKDVSLVSATPVSGGPSDIPTTTDAVARLNEFLKQEHYSLEFSVDETLGRVVIRITDAETDQLIRQIPPEEVLAMVRRLAQGAEAGALRGLLVSESV